jgi:hypothetical protein
VLAPDLASPAEIGAAATPAAGSTTGEQPSPSPVPAANPEPQPAEPAAPIVVPNPSAGGVRNAAASPNASMVPPSPSPRPAAAAMQGVPRYLAWATAVGVVLLGHVLY